MDEKITFKNKRWFDVKDLKNEVWKDIEGFEGIYQVSNYGRVKRIDHTSLIQSKNQTTKFTSEAHYDERILKPLVNKAGYIRIRLCNKRMKYNKLGHMLVAKAFLPNPSKATRINHINGDKTCNYITNLEWKTNKKDS